MVPESPSVCFRCKMCKVCFLTMNEIERHLKATNHYIRPSSNNSNSTKEKSTANETSDDKPLNLSSKSSFPPLPSPTKSAQVDLTVSSEGSKPEGNKNAKDTNAIKDTVELIQEKKSIEVPKRVSSRHTSVEEASICMKSAIQDDLADVETDTVSSTSSDPPPPPHTVSPTPTPPPPETITESEVSTQFPEVCEENSHGTCTLEGTKIVLEGSMDGMKKKGGIPIAQSKDQAIADSPISVSDKEQDTMATLSSQKSTNVVIKEKAKDFQEENRILEECEIPTNENDEPVVSQNGEKEKADGKETNLKPVTKQPHPKKRKQKHKYRCKHCAEMFTFPVQVHMHMQKVHSSASGESTKLARRSSINSSANNNNNNNNNDATKHNVQMYPLRSLVARAKRRTRSMQSDGGGGGGTRRNSLLQNNDEKKEKKSTTRKTIHFSCKHCGKKFPLLNQLKIHLHKVHPEKVKKTEGTMNGGLRRRRRKHLTSRRPLLTSKRRQTTPVLVQTQNRSLRISTRSASRSADSEPETMRMSTRRRSSAVRSEKSCVGSASSSRRNSNRRELERRSSSAKTETKVVVVSEEEEKTSLEEKSRENSRRSSGSSMAKKRVAEESESLANNEEELEEKPDMKVLKVEEEDAMNVDEKDEDTIYNDSDCMIIDTVETILYALTSKRSQTCPNCNKYCKFAGNFKLHLKACMNLDDDLEVIRDDHHGQKMSIPPPKKEKIEDEEETGEEKMEDEEENGEEKMEYEQEEGEGEDQEEEGGSEVNSENDEDDSSSIPYYQKLDYRRCWECGFIVSKFHNLSRHLKQRHNINMGTKEMHAKQAEILRLK